MTYIHERADWPNLRWSDEQLAQPLAAVRHRQGRLIGHMEALGFPLREEAVLQALTEDVSASHSEATSKFFAGSSTTGGDAVDGADLGSMFLAPPMAPRPNPRPRSARKLRARFRARHFMKPPWMR